MQSVNSEDTVTWSVFQAPREPWISLLLERAFGKLIVRNARDIHFWERDVHPDTGGTECGPEADVDLRAQGWRYVVEAKWRADLDHQQGKDGKVDQLQMRASSAQRGPTPASQRGALVIAPSPTRYPPAGKPSSTFASISSRMAKDTCVLTRPVAARPEWLHGRASRSCCRGFLPTKRSEPTCDGG